MSLAELVSRHAAAPNCDAATPVDLGGAECVHDVRMGRLLISAVWLVDDGLKGGGPRHAVGHGDDYGTAHADTAALAAMGLPTSFSARGGSGGSGTAPSGAARRRRGKGRSAAATAAAVGRHDTPSPSPTPSTAADGGSLQAPQDDATSTNPPDAQPEADSTQAKAHAQQTHPGEVRGPVAKTKMSSHEQSHTAPRRGSQGPTGGRVCLDPDTAAQVRMMLPRRMAKYWLQRYSLFSRFDEGVQLDTQSWYSVTPEVMAIHQARTCARYVGAPRDASTAAVRAVDAMAGVGGNALALARCFASVTAVELCPERCAMLAHNARVYAAGSAIDVVCADFFAAAGTSAMAADVVLASPPWGGPQYHYADTFSVVGLPVAGPHCVSDLLDAGMRVVARAQEGQQAAGDRDSGCGGDSTRAPGVVALFLPRNTDLAQLEALVPERCVWHAERSFLNGVLKGLTVYCFPPPALKSS